jgi:hypothetical protein
MNHLRSNQDTTKIPWRVLLALFLLLAIITTAVPVVQWAKRPPGGVFTGYSMESVGDVFVYLNLIEQAKNGSTLFTDMFTPEPHEPALIHPLFLVTGRIAALCRLSPLVAWHLVRIILLGCACIVLWFLVRSVLQQRQRCALVLFGMVFAAGFALEGSDALVFIAMLYSPKSLLALLCTVVVLFTFFLMWNERATIIRLAVCFFAATLLVFVQPYPILLCACIPVIFGFIETVCRRSARRRWAALILVCMCVVIAITLLASSVLGSEVLLRWSLNAAHDRSMWKESLLLVLPFAPLAIIGFITQRKSNPTGSSFMLAWCIGAITCGFSRYPYAYRLIGYAQIPLAYFAALGAAFLWAKRDRGNTVWSKALVVFLGVVLVSGPIRRIGTNLTGEFDGAGFLHLSSQTSEAIQWIRATTPTDSVFLVSPSWDTLFAQQAYRRVFVTMGWQTLNFGERINTALDVYGGAYSEQQLNALLAQEHIGYLVVSEREKRKGIYLWKYNNGTTDTRTSFYGFSPERYPSLRSVFQNKEMTIYKVDIIP